MIPSDDENTKKTVASIEDEKRLLPGEILKKLASFFVPIEPHFRVWEYSKLDNDRRRCYYIAKLPNRISIIYSIHGHGEYGHKWGVVDDSEFFGDDGGWYSTLREAANLVLPLID